MTPKTKRSIFTRANGAQIERKSCGRPTGDGQGRDVGHCQPPDRVCHRVQYSPRWRHLERGFLSGCHAGLVRRAEHTLQYRWVGFAVVTVLSVGPLSPLGKQSLGGKDERWCESSVA
jgi:hypothetical protein